MTLTRLKYFTVVAHYENLTQAAKDLDISQPALSKSIKLLEHELKVPLFTRKGNAIQLNQNGHKFLTYCHQMLTIWEQAQQDLTTTYAQRPLTLSLQVASYHLTALLDEIHLFSQGLSIIINQRKLVANADLIISSQLLDPTLYEAELVLEEAILLAIPPTLMTPALRDEAVSIKQLSPLAMIALTEEHELRQTIDQFFQQRQTVPTIQFEIDNPSLFREMIDQELGVALVPQKTWHFTNPTIQLRPIEQAFNRQLYVLTRKNTSDHGQLSLIKELVVNFFKRLNDQPFS